MMEDECREKVISNLKGVHNYLKSFENTAKMGEWVADVLTLLKEQPEDIGNKNAVHPVQKKPVEITVRYGYDCVCGAPLLEGQPYCGDCGKKVNWSE